MLEKGKKYMFSAKKAKKNKVEGLYGDGVLVEYYNWKDTATLHRTGRFKPNPTNVMWVETDPFEANSVDGFGDTRSGQFQLVKICRPFNGFEITEMIFSYPGPLIFITEAMPPEGQKAFEDKFIDSSLTEVINDLW